MKTTSPGGVGDFLGSLETRPRLLGIGEPMHGEEEFPLLRNRAFRYLVEREGYRSVAIESGCLAALKVDTYVAASEGPLDVVMEGGFSHGFGGSEANRELVACMREHNRSRAPEDRLRFYGFDAPIEITGTASPREARRGPTLVFAHNGHLRKDRSEWLLPVGWGGGTVSWWGAGAITAARMGDSYAFLASALGSAPDRGLGVPGPDTLEGALYAVARDRCIFDSKRLVKSFRGRSPKPTPRTDASTIRGYSALDPDRLNGTDAVVFVKDAPSSRRLTRTGDPDDT